MKLCFLSGLKDIVGREEVEMAYTGRLSGLLGLLASQYGERLGSLLFDPEAPERRNAFVKVLVEGEDVGGADPELQGEETIFLFLPLAGG